MDIREECFNLIKEHDYGLEEMKDGSLDLYNHKFLFIDKYSNFQEMYDKFLYKLK